ncbi:lanthionine synthetase C family protein [Plantactinospora sp. CA-290183]|uniref:lanthionine synthetase C family protein n=1 Tax=Plantactinospora sp. CA-290183 TaxID=3240006 RepID=UPI003D8CCDD1
MTTTTSTGSQTLRQEAAAAVAEIAARLDDPERVAALALASAAAAEPTGQAYAQPWIPLGLADSYVGVAPLYAELGQAGDEPDDRYRKIVHDYLSQALQNPQGVPASGLGLYLDAVSIAFVATCAGTRTDDFSNLGRQLDDLIAPDVDRGIARIRAAIEERGTVSSNPDYDVVSGLTGLGRLQLMRHLRYGTGRAGLDAILGLFAEVATAPGITVDGTPTSPWYSPDRIGKWPDEPGLVNLGIAHGVAGPLALLAFAQRDGVTVPGTTEAADGIARLLLAYRSTDEFGPYWPAGVSVQDGTVVSYSDGRMRDAWCYGTFGVARALQVAGQVFARPDWVAEAVAGANAAVRAAEARPELVTDFALCHGWAGILHTVQCMALDTGDAELAAGAERMARRVLSGFDPDSAFCYREESMPPVVADRPGFLLGSAGIALALHAFATGRPSVTTWDAALMYN